MDIKLMIMFVLLFSGDVYLLTSGAPAGEQVVTLCKDRERETLLTVNQGYNASWGTEDEKECCNWDGVSCNDTTGHVDRLYLSQVTGDIAALLNLHDLNWLTLSGVDFGGNRIPEVIGSFRKLEYLDLSGTNVSGEVPHQLGNLTNMRQLQLFNNYLTSKDLSWLCNLSLLSWLDLSQNEFQGTLSCLSNHSLLSVVDLSDNRFGGPISWMSNLTELSYIRLSGNQFEGPFPDLKALVPTLSFLYLDKNQLIGEVPAYIGQFPELTFLDLSQNFFEGTISDVHFTKLQNLTYLDLSFNSLALDFTPNWIAPSNLKYIILSGCSVGSRFPSWIRNRTTEFQSLDLSSCGISAEVPSWFWNLSDQMRYLNLSQNNMSGFIPDFSSTLGNNDDLYPLRTIDISLNNFSGPLPSFPTNTLLLDLSNNKFSGTIQSLFRVHYYYLQLLDLSYNHLSGDLSNCSENMRDLSILNLAGNKFDGHIPPGLGSLGGLRTMILRNNNLTGELPSALRRCRFLQLIDCGGNELTGNVPTWMGSLTSLVFLILGQNNFYGNIPPEICHLSQIQVLDLSQNNMSGRIPQCFQDFTSLIQNNGSTDVGTVTLSQYATWKGTSILNAIVYVNNGIVRWKRQVSEYKNILGLLKLIDLSSNNLAGNIPQEISRLAGLGSLNLSHNYLTGSIVPEIGRMRVLESLDLSRNELSGVIPTSLAELHYLAVLDLSSNNLSGEIPKSTQLQSFDTSAYAGNKELCGPPLPNCRANVPPAATQGNQGKTHDEKDEDISFIDSLREDYFISAILGYIVGFWILAGPLLIKRSWRDAYFGYLGKTGDWLYLSVKLSWRRLIRFMKSRS